MLPTTDLITSFHMSILCWCIQTAALSPRWLHLKSRLARHDEHHAVCIGKCRKTVVSIRIKTRHRQILMGVCVCVNMLQTFALWIEMSFTFGTFTYWNHSIWNTHPHARCIRKTHKKTKLLPQSLPLHIFDRRILFSHLHCFIASVARTLSHSSHPIQFNRHINF